MTPLLNGQAVKVAFASTSVTAMRGSMRLMKRAQVAPPKPPPTTTTRPGAPCAIAGSGSMAAEAPAAAVLRKSRRLVCLVMIGLPCSILLRAVPGGDGLDLILGEPLGDAVHDGRGELPRLERQHRGGDVRGIAADEPRHRGVHFLRRRVAAGTGYGAGWSVRRASCRSGP